MKILQVSNDELRHLPVTDPEVLSEEEFERARGTKSLPRTVWQRPFPDRR